MDALTVRKTCPPNISPRASHASDSRSKTERITSSPYNNSNHNTNTNTHLTPSHQPSPHVNSIHSINHTIHSTDSTTTATSSSGIHSHNVTSSSIHQSSTGLKNSTDNLSDYSTPDLNLHSSSNFHQTGLKYVGKLNDHSSSKPVCKRYYSTSDTEDSLISSFENIGRGFESADSRLF